MEAAHHTDDEEPEVVDADTRTDLVATAAGGRRKPGIPMTTFTAEELNNWILSLSELSSATQRNILNRMGMIMFDGCENICSSAAHRVYTHHCLLLFRTH